VRSETRCRSPEVIQPLGSFEGLRNSTPGAA
jgi:hypothetical protein